MEEQSRDILATRVADLIVDSRRIVVFTGAGISTESGIPDSASLTLLCFRPMACPISFCVQPSRSRISSKSTPTRAPP